jgi:hypothetical protein
MLRSDLEIISGVDHHTMSMPSFELDRGSPVCGNPLSTELSHW